MDPPLSEEAQSPNGSRYPKFNPEGTRVNSACPKPSQIIASCVQIYNSLQKSSWTSASSPQRAVLARDRSLSIQREAAACAWSALSGLRARSQSERFVRDRDYRKSFRRTNVPVKALDMAQLVGKNGVEALVQNLDCEPDGRGRVFQHPNRSQQSLPYFKVCVFGPQWCGKSRLVVRFLYDTFEEDNDPTVEDNYSTVWKVDGADHVLHLRDTSGDSTYDSMHERWVKWADGFVCCFNVASARCFDEVVKLRKKIVLLKKCEDPVFVLVGCQCDRKQEREVSTKEGVSVAYRFQCPFYEVSARYSPHGDISAVFVAAVQEIVSRRASTLPNSPRAEFDKPDLAAPMVVSGKKRYVVLQGGQILFFRDLDAFNKGAVLNKISLLTCTPKPCTRRKFSIELWSLHERLILQLPRQEDVSTWTQMIQTGIVNALNSLQSEKEATEKSAYQKVVSGLYGDKAAASPEGSWKELLGLSKENTVCADCGTEDPDWCSINNGVLICIMCSGIHRSLGTHISKVRSLTLDRLDPPVLEYIRAMGNRKANHVFEGNLPNGTKPQPSDARDLKDRFVRSKYVEHGFMKTRSDASPDQLGEELLRAVIVNDLEDALLLVTQGANIGQADSQSNRTTLHLAILHGHIAMSVFLMFAAMSARCATSLLKEQDKECRCAMDAAEAKPSLKAFLQKGLLLTDT